MTDTIFIYGNSIDDKIRLKRHIETDSPAATRKILGMAEALSASEVDVNVVSMGRGRGGGLGYFRGERIINQTINIFYLPYLSLAVFSQIFSSIALLIFSATSAIQYPRARHIFYNQLSFYIPSLIFLRLLKRCITIDIEDGHIDGPGQERRPTGLLSNGPRSLFDACATNGALLACSALEGATHIRPVQPYYGIIGPVSITARDWNAAVFNLLMPGTLFPDTGCDLLAEAIRILRKSEGPEIEVHLTGAGPSLRVFEELRGGIGRVRVKIHERLSREDYDSLIGRMHVGLSLKLLGSDVANTTFPSKTIEFAENGLLLISTDVSDVRALFGEFAFYLESNDATELAELIDTAATDRARATTMAAKASAKLSEDLHIQRQGRLLREFLFQHRQ